MGIGRCHDWDDEEEPAGGWPKHYERRTVPAYLLELFMAEFPFFTRFAACDKIQKARDGYPPSNHPCDGWLWAKISDLNVATFETKEQD